MFDIIGAKGVLGCTERIRPVILNEHGVESALSFVASCSKSAFTLDFRERIPRVTPIWHSPITCCTYCGVASLFILFHK